MAEIRQPRADPTVDPNVVLECLLGGNLRGEKDVDRKKAEDYDGGSS